MTTNSGLKKIAIVCLLLFASAEWGCKRLLRSPGVTIQATNGSGDVIREVEIDFPSASFGIAALAPATTRSRWVKVTGSAPLKVIFTDASGAHTVTAMRLNPNDAGGIEITFLGSGKINFADHRKGKLQ
jgi:hypothetical protein